MPRNVLHFPVLKSKCASMGYHARMAEWEFEHIKTVARANREEQARLLTEKCRDDPAKAGIDKWALEIAAGGDLTRRLIGALTEAEWICRDQCADREG